MANKYQNWIEQYLARNNYQVLGKCKQAVEEMRETFPELKEVRGHVYCDWGKRGHAWLEDNDGNIIDPTSLQFMVIFEYEPWKPGDEVLVGKCMNCGEQIWAAVKTLDEPPASKSTCSINCERALIKYLNGEVRAIS